jgi:hypothetical protein
MEVHHHSGKHESNGWKSYVGEFLMLFLAVFCGFIAENLREGYVERERAHDYMISMVGDMQKDTIQLGEYITANREMIKGIDSLLFYLKQKGPAAITKVYVNSRYVSTVALFESENGTITQLKNAGGLRLIKDTSCINTIADYDQFNEHVKKQGAAYYSSMMELLNTMEQIMDFSAAAQNPRPAVLYLSSDPEKLRLFYNKCFIQKKIIDGYCTNLMSLKKRGTKGIALIRKKYHIGL